MEKSEDLTGKKIDYLTVIKKTDDLVISGRKYKAWLCKCDCGNEIIIKQSMLNSRKKNKSCGCRNTGTNEIKNKKPIKHMSETEKEEWNELYEYVLKIMGYKKDEQCLNKNMVMRLRGLKTGKYMDNKNVEDKADYSYKTILTAYKFSSPDIERGFRSNSFKNEMNKFNYAAKIVESNLSTVDLRMKQQEKYDKRLETMDMSHYASASDYNERFKSRKVEEDKHSETFKRLVKEWWENDGKK